MPGKSEEILKEILSTLSSFGAGIQKEVAGLREDVQSLTIAMKELKPSSNIEELRNDLKII